MAIRRTPSQKASTSRPAPSPMTEVETLREAFEERNREFASLEVIGIPEHVALLPEYLGQGPGKVLHDMLAPQLEAHRTSRQGRAPTDQDDTAWDALSLAARSVNSPLTEAETWRLCYRLAYLVGYGDTTGEAATAAVKAANSQRASHAGKFDRKYLRPMRERFEQLVPGICYSTDDRLRKKGKVIEDIAADLEALAEQLRAAKEDVKAPPPETVKVWLTKWHKHKGQGATTWWDMPSTWTPGQPWPPKRGA